MTWVAVKNACSLSREKRHLWRVLVNLQLTNGIIGFPQMESVAQIITMGSQSDSVSMHTVHTHTHTHTHTQTHTAVGEDVTTYSSLIGEVHEVHDDSSDFELPETVVA